MGEENTVIVEETGGVELKRIWQDTWFESWFVRKNELLHCRFIEYAWVLRHLGLPNGGTILDVGCGGSFLPLMLALQGFDVTASDRHPYDYGFKYYKFIQGDAATVKLPQKYDRIMMISALEHFGLQRKNRDLNYDLKAILNLTKYLRNDGLWIITVPFGKGKEKASGEYRVYTQQRLNKLFPKIVKQEYFIRENGFWLKSSRKETENIVFPGAGDLTVTCLVAKK